MNHNKSDLTLERTAINLVARLSPENRVIAERLMARKRAKKRQWSNIQVWAQAWVSLDVAVDGKPFKTCSPDDWTDAILRLQRQYGPGTVKRLVGEARGAMRHALGVSKLPPDLDDALSVSAPDEEEVREPRVLTDADFQLVLEHVAHHEARYHSPGHVVMKQAIMWLFLESGFRCDELRSLNWSNIEWAADGGAYIRLPTKRDALERGCRLKSGPRDIYIFQAAGILKAWQAMHPKGEDAAAPAFLGFRDRDGVDRLSKQSLNTWVKTVGERCGMAPVQRTECNPFLVPHDFRHTSITRAARKANLNVVLFSMYYWGIPNSRQVRTYVHVEATDLQAMVRSNLGLDDLGYMRHLDAGDPAAALASILEAIQAKARGAVAVRKMDTPKP